MIRLYRYGLLPPTELGNLVREQMRLAHRYRNTLVEIERHRRDAIRNALGASNDVAALEAEVAKHEARLSDALDAVKDAKSRTGRAAPAELRNAVVDARLQRNSALRTLRERRRGVRSDPLLLQEFELIDARAAELRRSARAYCGVFWGTYTLIESADEAARKQPLFDGAEVNYPSFVKWRGEGVVSAQVQGGLDAALLGEGTMVRVESAPERSASRSSTRAQTRRQATLALRIGSEKQRPVFARWPMLMHRPLPPGAVIKRATVKVRMVGPRDEWWVTFVVDVPEEFRKSERGFGRVGVDLGWRRTDEGLRVATWNGEDGATGRLVLPTAVEQMLAKADEIRSIRELALNGVKERIAAELERVDTSVPPELRVRLESAVKARSPVVVRAAARLWDGNRFSGDEESFAFTDAWRYRDFHLWQWETSLRVRASRRRHDAFRVLASSLARRYAVLAISDFDLRAVMREAAPESETGERRLRVRANLRVAAPGEARAALVDAFLSRLGAVDFVDARAATQTCHACGSLERWDHAQEVVRTCSSCGVTWDQDDNAALNIRTRCPTVERRDPASARSASAGTRWSKRKKSDAKSRPSGAAGEGPGDV